MELHALFAKYKYLEYLARLAATKKDNQALQHELHATTVRCLEPQKELIATREERDSLKLSLQIVSKESYKNPSVTQPHNNRVDTEP